MLEMFRDRREFVVDARRLSAHRAEAYIFANAHSFGRLSLEKE
jgi:hypothetical protein